MPEPIPPSKRPRRFWLFAPYLAVAALAVVGGIGWLGEKAALERGLDQAAARARGEGRELSWSSRRIDGWPFRLDLTLEQPRLSDPSGWVLAAPELKGEAYAYSPGRWIFIAPQGLEITRPGKGALKVTGQALRASLGGLGSAAPRFSFEGLKLVMTPEPGGVPSRIRSAEHMEAHLQPGPGDQAALLLRADGAQADLPGLATNRPLAWMWDSRLSHLSAFRGPSWPAAVQAWTAAGGEMTVVNASLSLGDLALTSRSGTLTVGPDGRIRGVMPLTLRQGGAALGALASARALDPDAARQAATVAQARQGPDGLAAMALTFQAGVVTLGPIGLGPALKVY